MTQDKLVKTWNWEKKTVYNSVYKCGIFFCPFLRGRGALSLTCLLDYLRTLDTNPLAGCRYYVYPFHSACLFSLLLMSFDDEKFLILMPSNLSIFSFIFGALGVFFKKMYGYLKVMKILYVTL